MIPPETIRDALLAAFPGARVEITDLTGTKDHYQAVIVAAQFDGKTRVEQHQMVYRALGDRMKSDIHALSLKTSAK
jgi:stress-induced morphogen